jgi:hypothetical protein
MKEEEKIIEKTTNEILFERVGKVVDPEFYSSSSEFLIMYPNTYSLLVSDAGYRKHSEIKIFCGIEEVTDKFYPKKKAVKLHNNLVEELMGKIAKID